MKHRLIAFLLSLLLLVSAMPALAESVSLNGYSKAGYEYVAFGSYPTGKNGETEPILWRVLKSENGEAYLLSEYILFAALVHGDAAHYAGWEKSDLFRYLNQDFLNEAFTKAEQAALAVCPADQGLVTLLSGEELRDASLGFTDDNTRLCEGTPWARRERPDNKKLQLATFGSNHRYSPWWSRTVSTDKATQQRRVMEGGTTGRYSVSNPDSGVRPAVYVKLASLSISGGSGTKDAPFLLESTATVPETAEAPLDEETAPSEGAQEKPLTEDASPETGDAETPDEKPPQAPAARAPFTAAADPDKIHALFPALTPQGFLPEGEEEFVHTDEKEGLWLYASQVLRIEINRRTGTNSKNQPLRWYEAQIFTRDESVLFDLYPYDETKYTNPYSLALADEIALKHHLVFATNSDYFIYRVTRDKEESYEYPIGTIIRDGQIFYTQTRKASSKTYPPLDLLTFYKDGSVKVLLNTTPDDRKAKAEAEKKIAEELIADGVTDSLAFGPILVENGEVSPRSMEFGNTPNPRTAFGYMEPGYYMVVMVESRIAESKGESCVWLGKKMAELGCQTAFNLDGGATSTMIFMGKQINKSGNYGDITNRKQNELLGIGISPNVK